ncbi:helix-turn-helix transcriptional regulator [Streptomyces sp. NPDC001939]
MNTTRGVARTPRSNTHLTPSENRALAALAEGCTTDEAREKMGGISLDTFNGYLRNIGLKQVMPPRASRASKVNAAYESKELPLPDPVEPPGPISEGDRALWIAVATLPTIQEVAASVTLSESSARRRIAGLRTRFKAESDPHLVTLGYAYGLRPASTVTAIAAG